MVTNIKDVIESLLKKKNLDVKLKNRALKDLWQEVVGSKIPVETRATSFRNGTLFVRVENPTWAQELILIRQYVIDEINSKLEEPKLKEIRVYVGKIEEKIEYQTIQEAERKRIVPDRKRYVAEPMEIADFELMDEIDTKYRKTDVKSTFSEEKICEICKGINQGNGPICPDCESLKDSDNVIEISSYVYEEPEIDFKKASMYVKDLTEHEFTVARKKVLDYKLGTIEELKKSYSGRKIINKIIRECEILKKDF